MPRESYIRRINEGSLLFLLVSFALSLALIAFAGQPLAEPGLSDGKAPLQLAMTLSEEEWAARKQYRLDRLQRFIESHLEAEGPSSEIATIEPTAESEAQVTQLRDTIKKAPKGKKRGQQQDDSGTEDPAPAPDEGGDPASDDSGGSSDTDSAPEPTPEPGDTDGGSSGSSDSSRDYTQRPFSDSSPWNRPIPADAQYLPAPGISDLFVAFTHGKDNYQNVGIAVAGDSDPLRPILYNKDAWNEPAAGNWLRYGNARDVELEILARSSATFPYDANIYSTTSGTGHQESLPDDYYGKGSPPSDLMVRVPLSALPSPDGDGHLVVFLPDGMALEVYATIILSSGEIVAEMASLNDYRADGTGWWNGRRASMLPIYGGVLRNQEVAEERIEHALAVNISRTILDTEIAWPAYAYDTNPDYSGSLPMGSLLAIPRGVNLDDLNWQTALGRAMAGASQNHGIYLVDRGGPDGMSIITETEISHPLMNGWHWSFQQDLDRIRDLLMWVPNNDP